MNIYKELIATPPARESGLKAIPGWVFSLACLLFWFSGFARPVSGQPTPPLAVQPDEPAVISIATFLTEAPKLGEEARVHVRGTVTHVISDRTYFIQDGTAGVYAFDKPDPPFHAGELVEVTGYPSLGGLMPTLQKCTARLVGLGRLPVPEAVAGADSLNPSHGMKLVRMRGRLVDQNARGGHMMLLRPLDEHPSFQVNLEAIPNLTVLARPEPGSVLEVVGVLMQRGGPDRRPATAVVLVRTISDLTVLSGPPFWNLRRVVRIAGGMALALALILIWVLILRHQVKGQTRLVEERFEREAALKALEDRFAKVFRASPDALVITRAADDVVLEVNPAFEVLAGRTQSEILGRREGELGIWRDQAEHARAIAALGTQGSLSNFECSLESRGGKRMTCLYAAEWVELHGERCRLGVLRDVTEQKRLEEERRALQNQLERGQRMESLGTLAGGIAHDFNNLLAGILGNADLARQSSKLPFEAAECLEEIHKASLRGRDLVQRILAFSRQESQACLPIALGPVVAEAARLLRASMPPGVWLETQLDPNCPTVLADATQIHQIVMNLGTNAGHAMDQKPGRVTISLKPAIVDTAQCAHLTELKPGLYACLSVSDEGVGMSPAVRERIFEPFFTTKGPQKGTGLGLAAVHGFVRNHGGAIEVRSAPGHGSTFSIFLPATNRVPEAAAQSPSLDSAPQVHGLNVLLIDDEDLVISAVQRMLQRLGHQVTAMMSATEAFALFSREPRRFDLILTDMNMPVLNGLELARKVRTVRTDVPVVLASGNISDDLRERAKTAGATRLIQKPITLSELEDAIRGRSAA